MRLMSITTLMGLAAASAMAMQGYVGIYGQSSNNSYDYSYVSLWDTGNEVASLTNQGVGLKAGMIIADGRLELQVDKSFEKDGYTATTALLFTDLLFLDHESKGLNAYLGLGIGSANHDFSDSSESGLALGARAGLLYHITPSNQLEIGYKYTLSNVGEEITYYIDNQVVAHETFGDIKSHALVIGYNYLF